MKSTHSLSLCSKNSLVLTTAILAKNRIAAAPFWVEKTVKHAGANWNQFYTNHQSTPFFKDRHWINREWDMESKLGQGEGKGKGKAILETGCGTGAFIYP